MILSLITKNSAERLGDIFTRSLESTLQLPYRAIILVDDSDSPATRRAVAEFAERHGKELVADRSRLPPGWTRSSRATARQTTIDIFVENFVDEWLMFVDDDCVLRDGWWQWVVDNGVLEDAGVGEVWGVNWDASPERRVALEALGIDYMSYLVRKFHERGGTHDTMYRRGAIADVKIPPELHVYEDAWLHHYVACRGWKSVVNPVGVLHFHHKDDDLKSSILIALDAAVKYGIVEYEYMHALRQAQNKLMAYLSLLRPVAGFPIFALALIRVYGLRRGLKTAAKRQWLKLWFRWQVLKRMARIRKLPNICEAIATYKA